MIKGLIFDFDGLILDTEHPQFQAWQEVYASHGCELQLASWAVILGTDTGFDPFVDLQAACSQPLNHETIMNGYRQRCSVLISQEPLLPGVRETISAARALGLKLAVASSSDRPWVVGHLDRFGLTPLFDAIRTREDVTRVKPAPDLFLSAAAAIGISSSEALVLEDSPNGIIAAQAGGIYAIAIPNRLTAQLDLRHADRILPSLPGADLPALLATIHANGSHREESAQ